MSNSETMTAPLTALDAQLAAEEAAANAAEAAISTADRVELAKRAKLQAARERKLAAESAQRELDIARRLDAACAQYGDARLEVVRIKNFPDSFIIRHDAKAFKTWQADKGKGEAAVEAGRLYSVAVIVDWNGVTDFADSDNTYKLHAQLKANEGFITTIVNAAVLLSGAVREEHKS